MESVYISPDSIRTTSTFVKGELGMKSWPFPRLLRIFQMRYTINAARKKTVSIRVGNTRRFRTSCEYIRSKRQAKHTGNEWNNAFRIEEFSGCV